MRVQPGKILAYTLLPQFMPRFRSLGSGFTFVSYFIAQVYRAVGLLPEGHPYLMPANMGRYGISHVVAETGLLLKRRHAPADQYAVYWLLMLALVLLAAQFLILAVSIFIHPAHAGVAIGPATNFFITTAPEQDLAFILLDSVFGVPDFFNSCVSTGAVCLDSALAAGNYWTNTERTATGNTPFPYPYHLALHSAFQLYSVALLVIAMMILCYFVFAVVAETAETGTPFGRRFNKVWAPVRLVVALGLLVPIANGLNGAQYIALYAAKFGSGFATNGWQIFADEAVTGGSTMLGDPESLVATVNAPPVSTLMTYFALVSTCKLGYEKISRARGDNPVIDIKAWLINPRDQAQPRLEADWDFDAAVNYFKHGNIVVRFGEYRLKDDGKPAYTNDASNVAPLCGEVTLPMTNADENDTPGAWYALSQYYQILGQLWLDATAPSGDPLYMTGDAAVRRDIVGAPQDPNAAMPNTAEMVQRRTDYAATIQAVLDEATTQQQTSPILTDSMTLYGWAGAGIWYNRIAQVNGSLVSSVYNLPIVSRMPNVMEEVAQARQRSDQDVSGPERYQPYLSNDEQMDTQNTSDRQLATALYHSYKHWSDNFSEISISGNAVIDAINAIFGTSGLFNMRANQDRGVHPLAQLVGIGRSVMESAVRNLGIAAFAGLGGGLVNLVKDHPIGSAGMAIGKFVLSIAFTGISIGFVLYYVLPFLPFIYFFFAVCSWIKGIFEAMVGVPLWALAHLRIDGQGLPGDAAMEGYFMILDIFLRPILIVFGMLGGIAIFSAQATILNDIWPLITSNIAGFDNAAATPGDAVGGLRYMRDVVDRLFYTLVYAIVVYMLAMSSFKMVDLVPNFVLRWMGTRAKAFSEQSEQSAEFLMGKSFYGANTATDQLSSATQQGIGGVGGLGQSFFRRNSGGA